MPEETLLAFDFGEKKIGIAIGNTLTRQARPLEIIFSEVRDARFGRIAALLQEFEERAIRYHFREKIIQVAKFALASFVDETVLTNNFPLKEEWEKYPLQLEFFGEQLAGNKFYDKLESMLRQIDVTADVRQSAYR